MVDHRTHHSLKDPVRAHARAGTSSASMAFAPARSEDPAWAHACAVPNAKNNTICLHCVDTLFCNLHLTSHGG